MERAEFQQLVRKHRKPNGSFLEKKLWDVAELAPLGGRIWPDPDPYMLRAYLTPRDPQFKWLWKAIKLYEPAIGEYESKIFHGVPHLYLHHFFRGDMDEEVHNHPWGYSASIILTGGYVEERWYPETKELRKRDFLPGDINIIRRDDFHRVTLKDPEKGCWTLFLSSDRVEEKSGYDWGFLDTTTQAFTPWGPWTNRRNFNVGDRVIGRTLLNDVAEQTGTVVDVPQAGTLKVKLDADGITWNCAAKLWRKLP